MSFKRPRWWMVGTIAACLALLVFIFAGYWFKWPWAGFFNKTLWDWLQLLGVLAIPVAVGLGTLWFTTKQSQAELQIAADNQREAALQAYLDKMTEQLLPENHPQGSLELVAKVTRVRTLTVLHRLDAPRKKTVLQFLYESGLLFFPITLKDADLSGIDLSGVNLTNADLSEINLSEVNLSGADLSGAKLNKTLFLNPGLRRFNLKGIDLHDINLSGADLDNARLSGIDLKRINLSNARLSGIDMSKANLSGANLSNAQLGSIDLSGADLSSANLSGTELSELNLNVWCEIEHTDYQASKSAKAKGALPTCRLNQIQKLCKLTLAAKRA